MIATIIVLLAIVVFVIYFCLKSPVLTSFATVAGAVFAVILAFNFYEMLAGLLISRSYAGQWPLSICFLAVFVFGFVILRLLMDKLISSDIDFGKYAKPVVSVICGILSGFIVSGVLLIALGMSPLDPKIPYDRFGAADGTILKAASLTRSNEALLNPDSMLAELFSSISKGALSSSKGFAVYHVDFVDQIHLNRLKTSQNVAAISGAKSIKLPKKNAIRNQNFPDGTKRTVVRVGINGDNIIEGGAKDRSGYVVFTPSQFRLICKKTGHANDTTGSAEAFYPDAYIFKGEPMEKDLDLSEAVTIPNKVFSRRVAWIDIAFKVPIGMTAMLLEFKQNVVVGLPQTVTSTGEIERQLDEEAEDSAVTKPKTFQPR